MAYLNRILLLCCALLLVAVDVLAQQAPPPSAWQKYRVEEEEFSIALPTVPAMTTYKVYRSPYQKERTRRELGVYADGVVYTIASDTNDPQQGLESSRERLEPSLGWEPSTEQVVNRDGVSGKQYTSSHPLGGIIQVFATKKHLYRIQAFGATAADSGVQHFFSSLSFSKSPDGIKVVDGPGTPFEPVDGSVQHPRDSVLSGKLTERKVVLLMRPEPTYTEKARAHGIVGTVVLKCVFSANGSVVNLGVVSDLPDGLTEQAIAAAKQIKFIPAAKGDKFVSMWMQLEYNFNLY